MAMSQVMVEWWMMVEWMTYHGSTYGMKTPYTDAMMVECFFLADFSGNTCVKPGDIFCDIVTP